MAGRIEIHLGDVLQDLWVGRGSLLAGCGVQDVSCHIRPLGLAGKHEESVHAVPDSLVLRYVGESLLNSIDGVPSDDLSTEEERLEDRKILPCVTGDLSLPDPAVLRRKSPSHLAFLGLQIQLQHSVFHSFRTRAQPVEPGVEVTEMNRAFQHRGVLGGTGRFVRRFRRQMAEGHVHILDLRQEFGSLGVVRIVPLPVLKGS